jgi:glycerol-3-phosphate acyltransferase PlsY
VVGYLAGSIPTGYWLVGVLKHEDIRKVGSGNIGATNVWRTYGPRYGVPVMVLDTLKGFVPRYPSVASISAAISLPVAAVVLDEPWPVIAFAAFAALAVVVLHRSNINRLRAGTETRFRFRRPATT